MKALLLSAAVFAGALVSACSDAPETSEKTQPKDHFVEKEPRFSKPIDMSQFDDGSLGDGVDIIEKARQEKIAKLSPAEIAQQKQDEIENPTQFLIPTAKVLPHAKHMRNRLRIIMKNNALYTSYSNITVEVDYSMRSGKVLQQATYTHTKTIHPQETAESHYFQGEESPEGWIHNIDGLDARAISVNIVNGPES